MFAVLLRGSAAFLSLPVVLSPLQFPGIPLERDTADTTPSRTEVDESAIILNVHYACAVGEGLSTETALERLRQERPTLYLIFFASLSVSRSMRTSLSRMGPFTFLVIMRPLSLPSRTLTLTWITSPVTPVRPIICVTSAGVSGSSVFSLALLTSLHQSF